MTDHTESDGRDHTRHGVHEGRLLHATPVLPAEAESASEYAELLADLDFYDEDHWRNVMRQYPGAQAAIRKAAAAIRALEARVADYEQTAQQMAARWTTTIKERDRQAGEAALLKGLRSMEGQTLEKAIEDLRADRDRLAGEVERLEARIETLFAQFGPAVGAERELRAEVARLTTELAAARENEARYLVVRDVTPAEADTFNAVKTPEQFDHAADALIAARRAGEGEV